MQIGTEIDFSRCVSSKYKAAMTEAGYAVGGEKAKPPSNKFLALSNPIYQTFLFQSALS